MKKYQDGTLNNDPLLNYVVLEKNTLDANKIVYTVKMEYESGFVYEHNVNLIKSKGDWYIKILDEYLEKNIDFKLVKRSENVDRIIEKNNKQEQQSHEINNAIDNVGIMSGILVRSFYGTMRSGLDTSNFYIPGPALN